MISVGITGGIGSGKTTVAKIWESLGARVIYADDLAKELMQTDPNLKEKLSDTFGEETYASDGTLNKPHLIKAAFHQNRVDELNSIVHPAIRKETKKLIKKAEESGEQIFAYEAAILLNKGRPDYLDVIVLVTSERQTRLERVSERDAADMSDVAARIAKQPEFSSLRHLVDYTIENNGSLEELREKSVRLYNQIVGNH
ncbi:dephospho-CoA kinase [Rhodohalobacter sp. 8-1]|uniref:dephospho-CoA kinase n=1 Tax=Rhodohalobacter sp. 8-1 TaxID=3131972 RepID=UPI0030ED390A